MHSRKDHVKFVEDSLYFIFLKAAFHKFYLVHSWICRPFFHEQVVYGWSQAQTKYSMKVEAHKQHGSKHCIKYRNYTEFPGVEILHSLPRVKDESAETQRKLCVYTKFPHQEIRRNYNILCSEHP